MAKTKIPLLPFPLDQDPMAEIPSYPSYPNQTSHLNLSRRNELRALINTYFVALFNPTHFLFFIHASSFDHRRTLTANTRKSKRSISLHNMVTTRSKTKILKACFSQPSMEADSDHQSTESGALIGSNDDLVTEILLRLPVTSILRFKSVSKHWRWLLSHRSFTLRYDNLSKSPGLFSRNKYVPFDSEDQSTPPFRSLDFCFDPRGITILQSCNGLLLCSSDRCKRGARKYYVFNPTTKQFAIIPPVPGGEAVRKSICFMGLAFHQTDCVHYKIVCLRVLEPLANSNDWQRLFQIQLYSSDTGEWKISIESFSAQTSTCGKGVYWNGAVHFPPCYREHFYFKLDVEELQSLPLPVEIRQPDSSTLYFGESRGHLHLIVNNYEEANRLHFNVYEMLSDYSGWLVKYRVELDELQGAFPQRNYQLELNELQGAIPQWLHFNMYVFEVIDVVRGEKDEDTFIVLMVPGKLITYNVHDRSFKLMFNLTKSHYDGLTTFHRYIEALASF